MKISVDSQVIEKWKMEFSPYKCELEDVEITVADHIQKVLKPNFSAAWEEVGSEFEKEETFALSSMKTLHEAVNNIINFLGMQPCERSDKVPENKNSHTLYLAEICF
eukprot:g29171.t1